jgi:hypothetical protein
LLQVVLNQDDAALCMAQSSYDTDSIIAGSSYEESTHEGSGSESSDDEDDVDARANIEYECAPSGSLAEHVAAAAPMTRSQGVSAQIDAKMRELAVMLEGAVPGAVELKETHEMMGQLWSICSQQQRQLSGRDQVCIVFLSFDDITGAAKQKCFGEGELFDDDTSLSS